MKRHLLTTALLLLLVPALAAHEGGVIQQIISGGPAEAAGLRTGDRIERFGDLPLASYDDLQKIGATYHPGDTVPVVVERDGATLTLSLTLGAKPNGEPSIGIGVALTPDVGREDPGSGTSKCFAWIEEQYRVEALLAELQLDRAKELAGILDCVERDTTRMGHERAQRFCKNVFQVHCSAGDLLAEIGEAKIARSAAALAASFGAGLGKSKVWRTCVEPQLYDAYIRGGGLLDAATAQAALLDDCTTNLDAAHAAGTLDPAQAAFVACCAGEADPAGCPMLASPDGACRGDAGVCLDLESAEWIRCSVLD